MHDISWGTKEGNLTNATMVTAAKDTKVTGIADLALLATGGKTSIAKGATAKELLLAANRREQQLKSEEKLAKKKELAKVEEEEVAAIFRNFRMRILVAWFTSNWTLVLAVAWFDWCVAARRGAARARRRSTGARDRRRVRPRRWISFVAFLSSLVTLTVSYRFGGSVMYIIEAIARGTGRRLCACCCYQGRFMKRPPQDSDDDGGEAEDNNSHSNVTSVRSILKNKAADAGGGYVRHSRGGGGLGGVAAGGHCVSIWWAVSPGIAYYFLVHVRKVLLAYRDVADRAAAAESRGR